MSSAWKRSMVAACVFAPCLLVLAAVWAKSGHVPAQAIQVAREFVRLLQADRFPQAFELTVQRGHVGNAPEALQAIARRELCKVDRLVSTAPFQSNGNRLRRLVSGQEVDPPQVQVEFEGECLLGVTIRRIDGHWRVFRFASHAG